MIASRQRSSKQPSRFSKRNWIGGRNLGLRLADKVNQIADDTDEPRVAGARTMLVNQDKHYGREKQTARAVESGIDDSATGFDTINRAGRFKRIQIEVSPPVQE
jgi:hypothetical protein